uniref:Uncharacterized protein n=1 Tax=Theropithecus gelada TaxID=9565 RepID=A0A8D2FVM9_THEGE
ILPTCTETLKGAFLHSFCVFLGIPRFRYSEYRHKSMLASVAAPLTDFYQHLPSSLLLCHVHCGWSCWKVLPCLGRHPRYSPNMQTCQVLGQPCLLVHFSLLALLCSKWKWECALLVC